MTPAAARGFRPPLVVFPHALGVPYFSPPRQERHGGPISASIRPVARAQGATRGVTPRQACPRPGRPRAQLAFKDSMVHGILQFTPSITFRYVLHRCESLDIRCRESSCMQLFVTAGGSARSDKRVVVPPPHRTGEERSLAHAVPGFVHPPPSPQRCAATWLGPSDGKTRLGVLPRCESRRHGVFSIDKFTGLFYFLPRVSTMILPQVHLRKPCYDFSFL